MQTVKEYFSLLYIIYISVLIASCLFLVFSLITIEANSFSEHDIPYIISTGVVMIVGYILSYLYSKKKIKEAKQKRGLREKLTDYRKVLFIPWIIISITIIFSIICYTITGEHVFVCTTLFSLVIFLLNKPSRRNLIERLDLENDEQQILENPKSAI
ncbi:hypothetical protein G7050_01165 [Dysgonomonas sp. HDW5A]|uniref:hypothetical protein n=1 Tax=unclassified Dysgonomonas TaxID=2630389 RepID=UPI0014090A3D|nr:MULTISPECIES: hypothetical protein [unclassified Dysgonomonas]QIK53104.1 hypothetical protein G7051_01540 [Dysgonomonas sp. HDW5B]QIK58523.1 hypothetical protein G7050_01165 [Dysgonomonas sp. HDW5A]